MSNPQSVPSQRILNGSKPVKNAFKRAFDMQAKIAEAMAKHIGMALQQALSSMSYHSVGKGKGKKARSAKPAARRTLGEHYPEQSARQERPKYWTKTVNGFQVMQRLPRHLQGDLARQFAPL